MEDKEFTPDEEKRFIKGFNEGYQLREHEPKLLDTFLKGLVSDDSLRLQGIKAGSKQREKELDREYLRKTLEQGGQGKEQERDKEWDR
ncbi:hypothetical protein [Arsenicibacter rosenii]|uniref:Uncharacterized protein n=1 Tax=Arsenicibacter rosenii TaxID=1750698 RepID=A0A1S2VAV7_9BACT|nr:hypothetical protein [Arsenicibacter rosenii]OIN55550.1 hypothetical protein BLX24_29575 [Arsenicibacter rosenii]